uniref:Uncharacterized protein n=1 Tax=Anguilla anguilla TaxID=7936 RepID=A0A0E9RFF4_ANGAN
MVEYSHLSMRICPTWYTFPFLYPESPIECPCQACQVFSLKKDTFRSRGRINLSVSVASEEKRTWVTEPPLDVSLAF